MGYTYLHTAPALPDDQRPMPDIAVYDELLHQQRDTAPSAASEISTPAPEPAPPHRRRSGSRAAQAESRRKRWLRPEVPVRELVTLTRDPDTGDHRVTDGEEYLGQIAREVTATGRRGRWRALDPHNTVLRGGPWDTIDEALTALLAHHLQQ
ncbi:hypothetical protein [Nocardia sp. NPDC004711]